MPVRRNIWFSLVVILGFLLAKYGGSFVYHQMGMNIESVLVRAIYVYSWWVIPVFILTITLFWPRNVFALLGLDRSFLKGLWFGFLLSLPMLLSSAIFGDLSSDLNISRLFRGSFLAGFMEELLYRGFLFGILFRQLKWGFISAAFLAAFIFGISHLYQSNEALESLGIFIVTFGGSGWFAWLYIEWDNNLWIPIFLHIFMNLSWGLFQIGDTALGSWGPNVFRAMTIALSIWLTVRHARDRGCFMVNRTNLWRQIPIANF